MTQRGPAMFLLIALVAALSLAPACPPALPPVAGEVVRPFAPEGDYAGHWGVDLSAAPGTEVGAVAGGLVTFAGRVAGRLSVTIHHGGGVRTSYSYLSAITVAPGRQVAAGEKVGASGVDRGVAAVHLSLRVGERYVDPRLWLACRLAPPAVAGRLAPAAPY